MKKVLAGILVATTVLGLVGCGNSGTKDSSKDNADKKEIVYGKSQGPYTELFEDAIVPILEEKGYTVKGVDLSDLQTADIALNDGEVIILEYIDTSAAKEIKNIFQYVVNARTYILVFQEAE